MALSGSSARTLSTDSRASKQPLSAPLLVPAGARARPTARMAGLVRGTAPAPMTVPRWSMDTLSGHGGRRTLRRALAPIPVWSTVRGHLVVVRQIAHFARLRVRLGSGERSLRVDARQLEPR